MPELPPLREQLWVSPRIVSALEECERARPGVIDMRRMRERRDVQSAGRAARAQTDVPRVDLMDDVCAYSMEGGVNGVIWSEVGKEVSSVVCVAITLLAISLTRLHQYSLIPSSLP